MTRSSRKHLLTLAVATMIGLPTLANAQTDQIYGEKGAPIRGTIAKISPSEVSVRVTAVTKTVPVNEITKIVFADEPGEMRTARDRALAGQYEDALQQLAGIDSNAIGNSVVRAEVGYYEAYCHAKLALTGDGDLAAAAARLKNFIGQNQTTYHFFEGVELLGDLYFAQNKYAEASMFYGLLARAPWTEYRMRAMVLQSRAKVGEGKFDEALVDFDKVLAAGVNTPEAVEQKMEATVGKAVCLAATGKQEEGISLVEDLIAKYDPKDASLFGRAYNALGACYEKAGKPKDALLAYLHTDLLFFVDAETHAESLYHLSQLWDQINKSDRANEARNLLRERYPGSRWTAKL